MPDPVNIGNPDEISMLNLAKEIIQLPGSRSKIVYQDLPEDDPKVRQPDISRAKALVGWSPTVDRRSGLLKTIEYFRAHVK